MTNLEFGRSRDYEALRGIISQWNANRLDLFELSLPNDELEFHGVMRFYYQSQETGDACQKVATKCIRVSSTATTKAIIETLIEKFRPDMRMLEVPEYALYEIHESGERRLNPEEKPLLVQLNWHNDDREGRFLLRRIDEVSRMPNASQEDTSFKRKLSKREKKAIKKQEKMNKNKNKENSNTSKDESMAEKLYTELPDTSFTRSISNPEAVMRRRRQQKLEKKLQEFRSKDGGPDTGGTLKIYGESLCKDVPYKTLLLSISDTASEVVEEMLEKYGLDKKDASHFALLQVVSENGGVKTRETYLDDDECPLSILMNHGSCNSSTSLTFHVLRKPSDFGPRKRKKRPLGDERSMWPHLLELHSDGSEMTDGSSCHRYYLPMNVTEVGCEPSSAGSQSLVLPPTPFLFPRHSVLAHMDGIVTITPSHREAETYVNNQRIYETTILQHGSTVRFGRNHLFRYIDPLRDDKSRNLSQHSLFSDPHHQPSQSSVQQQQQQPAPSSSSNYVSYGPLSPSRGRDNILPAVLEFKEETEDIFFSSIISSLDPSSVSFKLAPTYTLYMATRFRASTHYRPELVPEERAARLTAMLTLVSDRILQLLSGKRSALSLAFWMANSSELYHFLKSDRHISSFSLIAQDNLAESVQLFFKELVLVLQVDLERAMPQMLGSDSEAPEGIVALLSSSMSLLRKCRVNAALTIQLFSQLFHFINMWTFNQILLSSSTNYCTHKWGILLKRRLAQIENWAEKQGLELAADCHLARIAQAAHLLSARKNTAEDIASVSSICFKLNSLQLKALLLQYVPAPDENPISKEMMETILRVAENTVDELSISEGRNVVLKEDSILSLPFLLPEDGYSSELLRGLPGGLSEFLAPLCRSGLCVLTPQPSSSGLWTIYMEAPNRPSPCLSVHSLMSSTNKSEPEIQVIQLMKSSHSGLGLSIVAAKGVGKDRLGIYVKAVVEGGAAYRDGRLRAGDQLLTVDGVSLVGISQERAAEILMQTSQVVELEVGKQGAIYHGLATLLSQPSPLLSRTPEPNTNYMNRSVSIQNLPSRNTFEPHSSSSSYYQNILVPPNRFGSQNSLIHHPQHSQSQIVQLPSQHSQSQSQHHQSQIPVHQQLTHSQHQLFQERFPSRSTLRSPEFSKVKSDEPSNKSSVPFYVSSETLNQPPPYRGPEKPTRQFLSESLHTPTLKNGVSDSPPKPSARVRFQEESLVPSPISSSSSGHSKSHDLESPLENLRLSSVEREFRRRVVEYTNDDEESQDNELRKSSSLYPMNNHNNNNHNNNNNNNYYYPSIHNDTKKQSYISQNGTTLHSNNNNNNTINNNNNQHHQNLNPSSTFHKMEQERRLQEKTREFLEKQREEEELFHEALRRREDSGSARLDQLIIGHHPHSHHSDVETTSPTNNNNNGRIESSKKVSFITEDLVRVDPNDFINEAESLLNSSILSSEPRFDYNTNSGNTPSVIGAQEVYRDPRMKRLEKEREEKASSKAKDGAKLSFAEKMKMFAVEAGESEPKDKTKISKAQREIDECPSFSGK